MVLRYGVDNAKLALCPREWWREQPIVCLPWQQLLA